MQSLWLLAVMSLLVTLALTALFVRLMRRAKLGQHIRDYGPDIHSHKQGTPTMGGVVILFALLLASAGLYLLRSFSVEFLPLLLATVGFGSIGMADDLMKFFKSRSLGLKARHKLLLQFVISTLFFLGLQRFVGVHAIQIPFSSIWLELPGGWHFLMAVLVLMGTVNAMNFTDGLDGLAVGTSVIILMAYAVVVQLQGSAELFKLTVVLIAILLGFLWFNFYPAKVFLGDTGAFALGGFMGAVAISTGTQLLLPIIAFVPVLETLSVIIQVLSFKLFKVRVFKVSPLHHHFEKATGIDYKFLLPNTEWPEPTITIRFWIVSAVFALLGIYAFL